MLHGTVGSPYRPTTARARSQASRAGSGSRSTRSASHGNYTVLEGDTLSKIAARHGTTWQRIYAANKAVIGGDPNLIVPGQHLTI